jgi:phosphate:Na+ symporter
MSTGCTGMIVVYLAKIGQASLTEEQSAQMLQLLSVANYLEQVGDVVETNLVTLGLNRIDERIRPSPATREVVSAFHATVCEQFTLAIAALAEGGRAARTTRARRQSRGHDPPRAAVAHQADRLLDAGPGRVRAYTRESEMIEHLRRIYTLSRGLTGQLVDSKPAAAEEDAADSDAAAAQSKAHQ